MMAMVVMVSEVMPGVRMRSVRRVPSGVSMGVVFRVMMRRMVMGRVVMGRMVALMPASFMPTVSLGHRRVHEATAADAQIDPAVDQRQADAGQSNTRHLFVP
jgi:hypothetical protein